MKFYSNRAEADTFYIRSDVNDTLAKDIYHKHQLEEILDRVPILRNKVTEFMQMAQNEAITHTAEFEYA